MTELADVQGNDWDGITAYCVQCLTGHEERTADAVCRSCEGVSAFAVAQEKHRSREGIRSLERSIMLPGYVFLYSKDVLPFRRLLTLENVIRFLSYGGKDDFALLGGDLEFSRWVWRHRGLFACSRAVQAGARLRIVEGPLMDRIGTVLRIDRHNRNVCLGIDFDSASRKVWLPFVWTADLEAPRLPGALETAAEAGAGSSPPRDLP